MVLRTVDGSPPAWSARAAQPRAQSGAPLPREGSARLVLTGVEWRRHAPVTVDEARRRKRLRLFQLIEKSQCRRASRGPF